LVVTNEKISAFVPKGTPFIKAFQIADDVLRQGIQGIADIITTPSLINLDFADIKAIMKNKGNAHIGIGKGKGENRTLDAVRQAVQSPLLETSIQGASGIIVYVAGDEGLTLDEVYEAVGLIKEVVDAGANIIFGMGLDENLSKEVLITIIATGFDSKNEGKNRYTHIQRPMFTEADTEKMSRMYGYPQETKAEKSDPREEVAAATDDIPSPRIESGSSKSLPPFLLKLQQKNKGK